MAATQRVTRHGAHAPSPGHWRNRLPTVMAVENLRAPSIPLIGAFESTYQPVFDRDVMETTEHDVRWQQDFSLLSACNVRQLRYPLRWHRIEPERGVYDWRYTDRVLGTLHDEGFDPIVDLLHHTSYPLWIGDLSAPQFGPAFVSFVERVGRRYPWLRGYTVCNEPFTTFLLCGMEGVWPPHTRGLASFVRLAENVMPAINRASLVLRDLLPGADHVHVEVCERHTFGAAEGEAFADMVNDRRFLLTDLLAGRSIDPDRPFVQEVSAVGGDSLLTLEPGHVDVLGLDYYAHNQWHWYAPDKGTNVSPSPAPLSDLIVEYSNRYGLPCLLGETNIRGYAADRATWFKYTLEQCEMARDAGVDFRGYCWFPLIDSADWN